MNEFLLMAVLFVIMLGIGIYILHRGQKNLKEQLDGRLTQLLTVTKELAKAQGIEIGRAEAKKAEQNHNG